MARLPNMGGAKFLAAARLLGVPEPSRQRGVQQRQAAVEFPARALATMEVKLADDQNDLVEVTVKMPARLRDHLASICSRLNLKLDDLVCELTEKWLLGRTIALLEKSAEEEGSTVDKAAKG